MHLYFSILDTVQAFALTARLGFLDIQFSISESSILIDVHSCLFDVVSTSLTAYVLMNLVVRSMDLQS